jgi:PAS domain S-box-containing protein
MRFEFIFETPRRDTMPKAPRPGKGKDMGEEPAGVVLPDTDGDAGRGPHAKPYRGRWLFGATREELVSVLENAPCGITVMENAEGETLYINPAAFDMTGYDLQEAPTKRIAKRVMFADDKAGRSDARHLDAMLRSGQSPFLHRIRRKDGEIVLCEVHNATLPDGTLVGAWSDVTRRESAEEELKRREGQFRRFFDGSFDAALLFEKNRVVDCNQASLDTLRCPDKASLMGKTLWDLSCRDSGGSRVTAAMADRVMCSAIRKKLRIEWVFRRLDGSVFPAEVTVTAARTDGKDILYVLVRDMEAFKEAEKGLLAARQELKQRVRERTSALTRANRQLRERTSQLTEANRKLKGSREELRRLYEHLNRTREEERTRLAREVHDELGHFLMGLKMDLSYMRKSLGNRSKSSLAQTATMETQIDQALDVVGQICSDLRPHVLDQLGLPSAVEWHLSRFEKKTGIRCVAEVSEDLPIVRKEQAIVLFRVLQEAMSNILRHSGATSVRVDLRRNKGSLMLRVVDNGRGVTRGELSDPRSFGIIGIRERVRFWGGRTGFKGVEGKGTTVTISIPLDTAGPCATGERNSAGRKRGSHDQGSYRR